MGGKSLTVESFQVKSDYLHMRGYKHYHCFEPGKSEICLKALSKALKAKYKLNYNETLPRMEMFARYAAREIRLGS